MSRIDRALAVIGGLAAIAALCLSAISPAGASPGGPPLRSAAQEAGSGAAPAGCEANPSPGRAHCYLRTQPAAAPPQVQEAASAGTTSCPVSASAGWSPCNIQSAYGLATASVNDGKGTLVAVVDPYDDPSIEADLGVFRSNFDLPACTTADKCFKKVNQLGQAENYPTPDTGSSQEISLDVEMVSAVCPNCHILLVEANSNGFGDLAAAETEAVALHAKVISNSWGTGEFGGETGYDADWNHPGVAITFSSGDGAYAGGVQYPSASPYVTSVGGTQLTPVTTGTRAWKETAWVGSGNPPTQGSGSGCSAYEPKPPWQTDPGCATRMTADVSVVAADVITYDSYNEPGWVYEFGTSVSSPIVAGVYALNKGLPTSTIAASAPYSSPMKLYDITSGHEGTCVPAYFCQAGKGYDGPTGIGSPKGISAFKVAVTPPPSITSVALSGSMSTTTITISGSNLDPIVPVGSTEPCNPGDPAAGDNFGNTGLNFSDTSQGWGAGAGGDCIGLVLQSYSSSTVVFGFGDQYGSFAPAELGDSVETQVQGVTFSGTLAEG